MGVPKVTIVLPTYNGGKYISESIESVLGQSFRDYEFIIVDDCSIDDTAHIIERYKRKDARIRTIRNSINMKLPASLNQGMRVANGALLTWTSDDNIMMPDALQIMVDYFENNPNSLFVYTDWEKINESGAHLSYETVKSPENIIDICVVGPSFMYKKIVQDEVGLYSISAFYYEDYEYWLRISRFCRLNVLREVLYRYRIHDESLTSNKPAVISERVLKSRYTHARHVFWIPSKTRAASYYKMARAFYSSRRLILAGKSSIRAMLLYIDALMILVKSILKKGDK